MSEKQDAYVLSSSFSASFWGHLVFSTIDLSVLVPFGVHAVELACDPDLCSLLPRRSLQLSPVSLPAQVLLALDSIEGIHVIHR